MRRGAAYRSLENARVDSACYFSTIFQTCDYAFLVGNLRRSADARPARRRVCGNDVFFVADGKWPTDLALFSGERAAWAATFGGPVSTEGFNDLSGPQAQPLVFDDFTLSRDQAGGFRLHVPHVPMQDGDNQIVIIESDVIDFDFFKPINAFAIDWADFNKLSTTTPATK